jgi:polyphosphate kinase
MGDAVRLQYDPELPKEIVAQLVEELKLSPEDLYPGRGFTAFTDLFQLYSALNIPGSRTDLRCQQPFPPSIEGRISGMPSAAATLWFFIPISPLTR